MGARYEAGPFKGTLRVASEPDPQAPGMPDPNWQGPIKPVTPLGPDYSVGAHRYKKNREELERWNVFGFWSPCTVCGNHPRFIGHDKRMIAAAKARLP